jgi:MFS family permease
MDIEKSQEDSVKLLFFSYPDFRTLWFSGLFVNLAAGAFPVALAIAVLDAGGNAGALGLILAARLASSVLFSLLAGVLTDRLSRKKVMFWADFLRGILSVVIVFATDAPLWFFAVILFVMGAGEAFIFPASGAILPSILPEDKLPMGNAFRSISIRLTAIVGPGVGGALIALAGSKITFLVLGILYFVGSILILPIKENREGETPHDSGSMFHEIREGIRLVRSIPWIAACLLGVSIPLMLIIGVESVFLPIISRREFGSDRVFAISLIAFSIGATITAIIGSKYKTNRPGLISNLSWMFFIAIPISMAFPFAPWFVILCYFIAGAATEPYGIHWPSAIQREVPREFQGRVFSLDYLVSLGLIPIGMALAAPMTSLVGETKYFLFAAVVHLVCIGATLSVPGVWELKNPTKSSKSEQDLT